MSNLELSEETAVAPIDVFINGEVVTEFDLESTCQGIVGRLHETGNTEEIENAITNFNGMEKLVARAKSKLIFEYSVWYKLTNPEGNFTDWFVEKHGGEKLTVQKHLAVGELLLDDSVPVEVKDLTHKELVSVARAKKSGYDLEEHWDEIAHAGSEAEVNEIVRKVKNKPERSGTLTIKLYKDGTIMCFMGDVVVNLGWLNVTDRDAEQREDVKKVYVAALARIINNSRMKEE